MRLFIAVNFSEAVKDRLGERIGALRENSLKGSFVKRDNLHLTLVFLGEVEFGKLDLVKEAMDEVRADCFELKMTDLGRFRRSEGDIVWTKVEKSGVLTSIHELLTENLKKRGFKIEKGRYTPHVTLGRRVVSKNGFGGLCDGSEFVEKVDKISLMLSERTDEGMRYTEIYEKRLSEG